MIKLIKSSFYEEAKTKEKLVNFIKESSSFSMGKECQKFEKNFSQKQKRKFSIFVTNGSCANLLLIQSLLNLGKIKKGDKVGVSALTWATNVMPLIELGFEPVVIDCDLKTLNISPEELNKHKKKIKALFLTNVLGFCDNIAEIKKICDKEKIIFIEDNCESLGSKTNNKLLGNFGLASTFSFFVGHHLSTIEGGMICTDNSDLCEMLLITRTHGWDRNLDKKNQKYLRKKNKVDEFYSRYTFYDLAYNTRPTEINGFLGNEQLKFWDIIVKKRQDNFNKFQKAINLNNDFIPFEASSMQIISNFAVPVICKNEKLAREYKEKFIKNKIEIRPIIAGNICRQPFFKKHVKIVYKCPNADFIHSNGFYFGNNPELTKTEIKKICELLKK